MIKIPSRIFIVSSKQVYFVLRSIPFYKCWSRCFCFAVTFERAQFVAWKFSDRNLGSDWYHTPTATLKLDFGIHFLTYSRVQTRCKKANLLKILFFLLVYYIREFAIISIHNMLCLIMQEGKKPQKKSPNLSYISLL